MQEKLVIYIHAHAPANPDWVLINAEGVCSEPVIRGEPLLLAGLASERDVIVIVPADSILLTTVTLPKMNRARLLKALPFALEEQLVDEVESLHFASGVTQENGELPVAIVAHEKMQFWMAFIHEWQLKPDALIPLTLAVPLEAMAVHIIIDHMANVRTGNYLGFACDQHNLMPFLTIAFTDLDLHPSVIHIHNVTSHASANELTVTSKIDETLITPAQLLVLLAGTVTQSPYINLLQGTYTVKKARLPATDKMIKAMTWLVASWVALLFLYPAVSYFILGSKLSQINSQISQIYKRHFPAASSMVAPKLRMDDKLKKLEASAGENRLLLLMGYVGKGLTASQNVKLKRLDFQGGQLTMELTAASSDDFSGFADFLSNEGLTVKQQNATLSGTRVNATLQVE